MCRFDEHHQQCKVDGSDGKRSRSTSTRKEILQPSVKLGLGTPVILALSIGCSIFLHAYLCDVIQVLNREIQRFQQSESDAFFVNIGLIVQEP
ncbi:hypothetical protein D5086_015249 [Populus alba]|uniref:Uncharacterized protein n=1 Tax=Populus alba TaxID=43335 RepID=A0ACC4BZS4_POPAL